MGGLFSSQPEVVNYERSSVRNNIDQLLSYRYETNYNNYVPTQSERVVAPRVIKLKPSRLNIVKKLPDTNLIEFIKNNYEMNLISSEYKMLLLEKYDREYQEVVELFMQTTKKRLVTVINIYKIQNPYLMGEYLLRKKEMEVLYGYVEERLLFHGTEGHKIDSICRENFDWRFNGNKRGHKFGKGVSFSPISYYASNYCDKYKAFKELLVVKVLISRCCIGDDEMEIPPYLNNRSKIRYDTSMKEDGHVIVKYYDNEFYPAYKIQFTTKPGYYNKTKTIYH